MPKRRRVTRRKHAAMQGITNRKQELRKLHKSNANENFISRSVISRQCFSLSLSPEKDLGKCKELFEKSTFHWREDYRSQSDVIETANSARFYRLGPGYTMQITYRMSGAPGCSLISRYREGCSFYAVESSLFPLLRERTSLSRWNTGGVLLPGREIKILFEQTRDGCKTYKS